MERTWQSLRNMATWHFRSVEGSRVNALGATAALAGRRRERDEVDDFLAAYLATWESEQAATNRSA